ncbi:MAG: TldD/PmbA family protein [Lachnospiraceae bacterium]|nr:TldD/PmbA family protein [Lachnospiraceae bacterium]
MKTVREIGDSFDAIIKDRDIQKYTYTLSTSEKQELNLEDGTFKLMRTVFDQNGSVRVFRDGKTGSASGNDISEEGLNKLLTESIAAAESATEDPCHDIAPDQGKDVFRQGVDKPDIDRFIERVQELLDLMDKDYPKIKILGGVASIDRWNWFSRNSNGTEFEGIGGQYGFSLEISASEGDKTTGLDYVYFSTADLDKPFIEMADVKEHLQAVSDSIYPESVEGKFEGKVIMTPSCAENFLYMTIGNYISDRVIIDGTSQWLDKVGEKVADESLSVALRPFDERIVMGERGTQDGYRTEEVQVLEKGVLKTHLLSLYAANKTGRPVTKNTGHDLVVEPGDKSLEEMIASVDKGILMGGFSGGQPGTNGDFSGVAKNSFLIEKGKIRCALSETMVNGNLGDILNHICGISKEQCLSGSSVVPYIAVDGVIISGK